MIKNCSMRVKLLIIILSVMTPLIIFIAIYLLKGFQIIEVLRGYPYDAIILEEYTRNLNLVLMIMGVFILAFFITAYILEKCLFKPISVLKNTSEKFLEGDYSAKIEIKNEDDIGLVAEALNSMAESIETLSSSKQAFLTHIFHEF
ncbi:MAG: HAMP domain-containing protein, partial [Clostridiaceae bacterium]|nr:HAMP domain-containing protein [Clostridiaceae bacterium]